MFYLFRLGVIFFQWIWRNQATTVIFPIIKTATHRLDFTERDASQGLTDGETSKSSPLQCCA